MATDHRGNGVGNPTTSHGGHRPTPRLSRKLATYYGLESGETQRKLNRYRGLRDNPSNTYDLFDSHSTAEDIREGLRQPRKDFYQHYEDRGEMDKVNAIMRQNEDTISYPYRGYNDKSPTGGHGWGY